MDDYFASEASTRGPALVSQQQPPQQQSLQQPQPVSLTQLQQLQQNGALLRPQYMYNVGPYTFDGKEIFKRGLKYLVEGLAVGLVAYYVTKNKFDIKDIIILGITAAFVFAILDTFSPTVSLGARFGAGFGIGQTMFGVGGASTVLLPKA